MFVVVVIDARSTRGRPNCDARGQEHRRCAGPSRSLVARAHPGGAYPPNISNTNGTSKSSRRRNQHDLIGLRTQQGVHALVPGLTGWAQVNGRDELPIPDKVKLDVEYLHRQSLWFDIRILWLTLVKVLRRDGVSH